MEMVAVEQRSRDLVGKLSRGYKQRVGLAQAILGGPDVLILDDILDSGGTVQLVVPILRELGVASVKVCVLLRKDRPTAKATQADYVGFEIPDEFVVGYGLDYTGRFTGT